ncbi:MAG: hypothetical protein IKY02_04915 [Lachnospiraceae bacterium]|nr:hypothetical protein [Lachnospiraceae bacterium]
MKKTEKDSGFSLKKLFCGAANDKAELKSLEKLTLCESGMRGTVEYEILPEGEEATVTEYRDRYINGEKERVPERQAHCHTEEVLKVLNDCRLLSWDGFHGPHPKGVLDGKMFRLEAFVNGGRRIFADGSQNFPKHYRELTDWLYQTLNRKEV